jgi:hypothetical protein
VCVFFLLLVLNFFISNLRLCQYHSFILQQAALHEPAWPFKPEVIIGTDEAGPNIAPLTDSNSAPPASPPASHAVRANRANNNANRNRFIQPSHMQVDSHPITHLRTIINDAVEKGSSTGAVRAVTAEKIGRLNHTERHRELVRKIRKMAKGRSDE